MSNSLAIAAVTATVRNLLFQGVSAAVGGTDVTARPPDRARVNSQGNQVNVFLYQTSLDPAWRNQDMQGQVKSGEDGHPPLPLILYYLVTAYGENDDEVVSHSLLGSAMSILHDHPVLGAEEIKAALDDSGLEQQIERVRITPQPMTLEEMSKLWTTFQTQYRISAAYQACVVLIESRLPTRAPLPVLTRGEGDSGVIARASTVPPFPTIDTIVLPNEQASALPGDTVTLEGHNLAATASIRLVHANPTVTPTPLIAPDSVSGETVTFTLPDGAGALPAGVYAVSVAIAKDTPLSGAVPLSLAPRVTNPAAARDAAGVLTVTLDCSPALAAHQDAYLLLSDQQIALGPVATDEATLVFTSSAISAGTYLLRLRVDGVDSLLVDRSVSPPGFDPTQKVDVP